MSNTRESTTTSKRVPFVHPKVDLEDIHPNGRLLSDDEITRVRDRVRSQLGSDEEPARYSKNSLGTKYPIIVANGKMYAVYKGDKHGKALGSGAFGTAKLIQDLETGQWAVLKVIKHDSKKSFKSELDSAYIERENLERANINRANTNRGADITHYVRTNKSREFQIEIIMPLASGSTVKDIARERKMPAINWLKMSEAMLVGVQQLHQAGIYHRDIKPANMLYDPVTNTATPIDMGLAVPISNSTGIGPAGSPRYMAPEIRSIRDYNKKNKDNPKRCDFTEATEVFALGVSLAETLGIKVFENVGEDLIGFDLLNSIGLEESKLFKSKIDDPIIRKEIMKLLRAMTSDKISDRPTLADAIESMHDIQQKYQNSHLHVMSQINKLAYVDVGELADLINSQEGIHHPKFRELIDAMKEVHVVQLVSDQFNADQARLVRHVLQREGVMVMEQAYQFKDANNKSEELSLNTQRLEQQNELLYNAFYLKTDSDKSLSSTQTMTVENTGTVKEITASVDSNKKQNYSKTMASSLSQLAVTDIRLRDIISRINTQASKMKQDDPRKLKLEAFANNLKQPINYQSLIHQLKQAEKGVMGQSKGWSRFFEAKLNIRSTSTTKLMHDIRADVEHGVGIRKRR